MAWEEARKIGTAYVGKLSFLSLSHPTSRAYQLDLQNPADTSPTSALHLRHSNPDRISHQDFCSAFHVVSCSEILLFVLHTAARLSF